jgi:hypothetical protein
VRPYIALVSLHATIAVVGIGLFAAIPLVASSARRAGLSLPLRTSVLEPLFRYTRWSLAAIALTAILLDVLARGTLHSDGWFRASVALFVFLGASHARARAGLRKGGEGGLQRVERWGWIMCLTIAVLTVLMEAKPF